MMDLDPIENYVLERLREDEWDVQISPGPICAIDEVGKVMTAEESHKKEWHKCIEMHSRFTGAKKSPTPDELYTEIDLQFASDTEHGANKFYFYKVKPLLAPDENGVMHFAWIIRYANEKI